MHRFTVGLCALYSSHLKDHPHSRAMRVRANQAMPCMSGSSSTEFCTPISGCTCFAVSQHKCALLAAVHCCPVWLCILNQHLPNGNSSKSLRCSLVRKRIQWGIGRFCRAGASRARSIAKVIADTGAAVLQRRAQTDYDANKSSAR
jgi:hypothetical protein